MPHQTYSNHNVLFVLVACFALGCSKGDSLGCASDAKTTSGDRGGNALEVPSNLTGVYKVTQYQQSEGTCDQLVDISEAPSHLVLYQFEPNDGGGTRLGGTFCGDPNLCRAVAERASEPSVGYSFLSGDDTSGWQGWAIASTGSREGKCAANVQSHNLSPSGSDAIRIETKTVEVFFVPVAEEDDVATCSNKHAIAAASEDKGCTSLLILQATRESDL